LPGSRGLVTVPNLRNNENVALLVETTPALVDEIAVIRIVNSIRTRFISQMFIQNNSNVLCKNIYKKQLGITFMNKFFCQRKRVSRIKSGFYELWFC
jgi:hypothetical protein